MSEYVKNLEVTLEEEGYGYPEEAKETAFMAWDCVADVQGDDGRQYWIVVLPVTTMGERDAWAMSVSWVKENVSQYPNTAYNIANFPPGLMSGW